MTDPIMLGTWEVKQVVLSSNHAGSEDWVELAAHRGHSAAAGEAVEGRIGVIAGPDRAYCVDLRSMRKVARGVQVYPAEEMHPSTSITGPCAAIAAGLLVVGEHEAVVLPWKPEAEAAAPSPTPAPLHGHSIVAHAGDAYVFDGASASLWKVVCSEAEAGVSFEKVNASGDAPSQRRNQAMASVAGCLFVHGGAGTDAELYAFNLATQSWHCLKTGGAADVQPPGLEGHSLTVVGRRLVLFGGLVGGDPWNVNTELYVATLEDGGAVDWSAGRGRNPNDESKPSPRGYHAATAVVTPSGLALAVFGGVNQSNEAIVHSPIYLLRFKDALAAETADGWKLNDA
eukprot:gene12996-20041_t